MVPSMLMSQTIRLPNKVNATEKLENVGKRTCAILCSYMATPVWKWNDKCISQQRIFRELIQWRWTTRWDIIRIGQRSIVLRGHTTFLLLFVVEEKRKNTVWTCEATCKGSYGESSLSVWVSQSIDQSRSVDDWYT